MTRRGEKKKQKASRHTEWTFGQSAHGLRDEDNELWMKRCRKDLCWEESLGKVLDKKYICETHLFDQCLCWTDAAVMAKLFPKTCFYLFQRRQENIFEYLCLLWMTSHPGRWVDIGLTGLWGRHCLFNDYYHRNLCLAVLNAVLTLPRPHFFVLIWASRWANRWGLANFNLGIPWVLWFAVQKVNVGWNKKGGNKCGNLFSRTVISEKKKGRHVQGLTRIFSVGKKKKGEEVEEKGGVF